MANENNQIGEIKNDASQQQGISYNEENYDCDLQSDLVSLYILQNSACKVVYNPYQEQNKMSDEKQKDNLGKNEGKNQQILNINMKQEQSITDVEYNCKNQKTKITNQQKNTDYKKVMSQNRIQRNNIKNIKIISQCILYMAIMGKLVFHYVDTITDILLIYQHAVVALEYQQHAQYYMIMNTYILILSFSADRIFTYIFLRKVKFEFMKIQCTNNSMQKRLSFKDKLFLFMVTFCMCDYIYILYLNRKHPQETSKKMIQKSLIELICENFMFLLASLNIIILKIIEKQNITYLDILTLSTSFFSVILVIFKVALQRYNQQYLFKRKDEIKYEDMDVKTQRYVSYPYSLSYYKLIAQDSYNYPQIFNSQQEQELKQQQLKPLNLLQKLNLLFAITLSVLTMAILQCSQNNLEDLFLQQFRFLFGLFAFLPQCIVYLKTFRKDQQEKFFKENEKKLTEKQRKMNLKSETLKMMAAMPYLYLVGYIELKFPIGIQTFPFFDGLRENWCLNFNSTVYGICFRLLTQFYDIFSLFYIMTYQISHPKMEQMFGQQNIQDRIYNISFDNPIFKLIFIATCMQCVLFIYSIVGLLQNLKVNKLQDMINQLEDNQRFLYQQLKELKINA